MHGIFSLKSENHNNKTVVTDMFFTPPYKTCVPFYENNRAKVVIMSCTAGILSGDNLEINISTGDNCDLTVSDQGYTKIFNTRNGHAIQKINISAGENSRVSYLPHPIIPFENSNFTSLLTANLKSTSKAFISDITSSGRVAMGECFSMKSYQTRMEIFIDDKLVMTDNTAIIPSEFDYTELGFFENYTHIGLLYAYLPQQCDENKLLEKARNSNSANIMIGASRCQKGVVIRTLANTGDEILNLFNQLAEIF